MGYGRARLPACVRVGVGVGLGAPGRRGPVVKNVREARAAGLLSSFCIRATFFVSTRAQLEGAQPHAQTLSLHYGDLSVTP